MKATPKTTVSMPKVIGATVVKLPKAKKLPGALAKPSKFYKGEEISKIKKPSIQKLSDFLNSVSSNQSKLRKYDFNEDYMSNDKKISAEEAARAVLAKVAEMLQASPLVKAASYEKGINPSVGASSKGSAMTPGKKAVMGQSKAGRSLEDTQGVGPAISAKPKAEGVLNEIKAMPKPNIPGPKPQSMAKDESSSDASSMSSKGIHKLSKFVGKMEGKKGAGYPNGEPNLTKSEHFELAKKLHNELTASSSLVKSEEKKAPGSYGNVTPHLDHVGMAGLHHLKHHDLKLVHRQHAAVATAKGDTGLADKHGKMANMHQHYDNGIMSDHRHIVVAGKLHEELSGKKGPNLTKSTELLEKSGSEHAASGAKGNPVNLAPGDKVRIKGMKQNVSFKEHTTGSTGKKYAHFHGAFGAEHTVEHEHLHDNFVTKVGK